MKIEHLEQAVQRAGLNPIKKIEEGDNTIYLAETDLEINREYPFGYYQTAWFLATKGSKGLEVGRALNFERSHDKEKGWTETERRERRIKAALEDAREWIKNSGKV